MARGRRALSGLAMGLGTAWLGAVLARDGLFRLYPLLRRPPGAPDPGALAAFWLAFCLSAGLGLALAGRGAALTAAELAAGLGWWGLFFGLGERGAALVWLAALLLLAPAAALRFARASLPAALLQLPWLACLFPAACLHVALWLLNRG